MQEGRSGDCRAPLVTHHRVAACNRDVEGVKGCQCCYGLGVGVGVLWLQCVPQKYTCWKLGPLLLGGGGASKR